VSIRNDKLVVDISNTAGVSVNTLLMVVVTRHGGVSSATHVATVVASIPADPIITENTSPIAVGAPTICLEGQNFGTSPSAVRVYLTSGGALRTTVLATSFKVFSETLLCAYAAVSSVDAGGVTAVITVVGVKSVSRTIGTVQNLVPSVSQIVPMEGPMEGHTLLNITGANLGMQMECMFGAESTPVISVSVDGTLASCHTPQQESGSHMLRLRLKHDGSIVNMNGKNFTFHKSLFIADAATDSILRFNLVNGTFVDTFINAGVGGLHRPGDMVFGPDKNFYVANQGTSSVLMFHGQSGAFLGHFCDVPDPRGMVFHYRDLYVVSAREARVYRFNGVTGAPKGVYADMVGFKTPQKIMFEQGTNYSYISSELSHQIVRYKPPVGGLHAVLDYADATDSSLGTKMWAADFDQVWTVLSLPFVGSFDFSDDSLFAISMRSSSIVQINRTTGQYISQFEDPLLVDRPAGIKVHGSMIFVCADNRVNVYHLTSTEYMWTHLVHQGMRCGSMLWHQDWQEPTGHV